MRVASAIALRISPDSDVHLQRQRAPAHRLDLRGERRAVALSRRPSANRRRHWRRRARRRARGRAPPRSPDDLPLRSKFGKSSAMLSPCRSHRRADRGGPTMQCPLLFLRPAPGAHLHVILGGARLAAGPLRRVSRKISVSKQRWRRIPALRHDRARRSRRARPYAAAGTPCRNRLTADS